MMNTSRFVAIFVISTVVLLSAPVAFAAPQILAVAATKTPLEFQCQRGVCEVELSAMCLQENRRFPTSINVYHPSDSRGFTIVMRDAKGGETRMPAGSLISIRSKRSFTAVAIRIQQKDMESLNAVQVALEVAEGVSLIPETPEFDMYPFAKGEVENATGPLRTLAAGWLSGDSETTVAVRMVNRLINNMPLGDRMTSAQRRGLWQDVFPAQNQQSGKAFSVYNDCLSRSEDASGQTMRSCLEMRHDSMIYGMNKEYWVAAKIGS